MKEKISLFLVLILALGIILAIPTSTEAKWVQKPGVFCVGPQGAGCCCPQEPAECGCAVWVKEV